MNELFETLRAFGGNRVLRDEPMALHTTFRVGGKADIVFMPESADEINRGIELARRYGIKVLVIGNGSNLIVRDSGFHGLVIILGEHYSAIRVENTKIYAQAGASLARVASVACEHGLAGLEFAGGIPGSLGGGCAMNAGAYGGELKDVLVSAEVLTDKGICLMSRDELDMSYRSTLPLRNNWIVLSAVFELKEGDPAQISATMKELNARRRDKQPLNYPSAGSTFKRPQGNFAGALIEQCGLKGKQIGGAAVSEKHAGFIVNVGGSTAKDILDLIAYVQKTVKQQTGYELETEVRIVGEE